jgi:hypothetical protein
MLFELQFPSYNERDQVQAWYYVPAAKPKGFVLLVHGFGEHSRRVPAHDLQICGRRVHRRRRRPCRARKNSRRKQYLGQLGDRGFVTMVEDEKKLMTWLLAVSGTALLHFRAQYGIRHYQQFIANTEVC